MNKYYLFLILLLSSFQSYSQEEFVNEMKKLAENFSSQLQIHPNKKIAVLNFTNMEDQATALGRTLAEVFSNQLLSNKTLTIINRAQFNRLLEENKMLADKRIDDSELVKLGEMKKIDIIISGTITPFDKTVMINLQAIDITKGQQIAGDNGFISRTNAIEFLLRDKLDGFDETKTTPNDNILNKSISNYTPSLPSGDSQVDLKLGKCSKDIGGYIYYFGEVCFENRSGIDFEIYEAHNNETSENSLMMVGKESRNCYGLLPVSSGDYQGKLAAKNGFPSSSWTFKVRTTEANEESQKYGQIRITVDGCKITTRVIDKGRITFSNSKK